MSEQTQFINPFGDVVDEDGNVIVVKRVISEATRSETQIRELISNNTIEIENEWYALFKNGTLIEKGRSKVSSSEYLEGKKHINIKDYYEVL